MKRRSCCESNGADPPEEPRSAKKLREEAEPVEGEKGSATAPAPAPVPVPELGEDAIYEVLRRADARTLAAAACVSRRWRRLAADERLWEAACVRHWEAARDYGGARLRPVVLALGGFRRLHSLYLAPLLRPSPSPSPSSPSPPIAASPSSSPPIAAAEGAAWPITAAAAVARAARPSAAAGRRWGRDEVQLSLSLLSIGFFERMSVGEYKGCGGGGGGGAGGGGVGGGGGGEGNGKG